MGQILRLDSDATVAYANDCFALFRFRGEPDSATWMGVLRRIEEQIHEYLLESGGVCLYPYRRIGK